MVPFAASSEETISSLAASALSALCAKDAKGDVSLEVVHQISQLMKHRSYNVRPRVSVADPLLVFVLAAYLRGRSWTFSCRSTWLRRARLTYPKHRPRSRRRTAFT